MYQIWIYVNNEDISGLPEITVIDEFLASLFEIDNKATQFFYQRACIESYGIENKIIR